MYTSQLGQDILIDKYLKQKINGYFLDIGASYAIQFSNSCFFERERKWKGVAVEHDIKYQDEWLIERPNSVFICGDATKCDYQRILDENNAPKIIDYLSIDVDPPTTLSLECLYEVFKTDYQFNTITFETDYGGDVECNFTRPSTRDDSREFLKQRDYILITEIYDRGKTHYHVDDFWVHKSIYDENFKIQERVVIYG